MPKEPLLALPEEPAALSRRGFLKSATCFAGAVVSASLSGCRRNPGVPGARVTLTQWYHQYGEKGTEDAVRRYALEYTRAHPDVAVQVVWVPGDYQTKLNTALLTAGGPDVFEKQLSVPMVSAQQVAPLDDLFTPEIKQQFLPDDLRLNTVDGRIYGVKMVGDMGLLYYRPSLLEKAGLKPPSTWDELLAASKALTTRERKGLFVGNDGGVGALLNIAPWSAGSDFLKGDKILFDNPRTVQSYEKLRELGNSPTLLIGYETDWWDPTALAKGQCAMQWGGLWAFPAIKEKLGEDVGAVPWPALDQQGSPVTFAGGWSQMVNAQSPNVEEAKKFVRWLWLENEKIQTDWNLSYGFHVPPRLDVARSASALSAGVPAQAVKIVAEFGRIVPPQWSAGMNTILNDAASNIVKQGRDAQSEVSLAARKCERELARLLRYKK